LINRKIKLLNGIVTIEIPSIAIPLTNSNPKTNGAYFKAGAIDKGFGRK
jgi:hypothetical protein